MIHRIQSEVQELTERQLEILSLVSKGCSNVDIARLLAISPNTVKAHVATILERLDVSNRTEASVLYEKHVLTAGQGLNSPDGSEPLIGIRLLYQRADQCRWLADQLAQLLQGFEVFSAQTVAVDDPDSDNASLEYQLYVRASESAHRLILLHQQDTGVSEQIFYTPIGPVRGDNTDALKQHALSIYRAVLTHWCKNHPSGLDEASLFQMLKLSESIGHSQHSEALALAAHLIGARPDWHLPHALKAMVVYKAVATGHQPNAAEHIKVVAEHAKQALMLNPDSGWSQLAFAYFCVLSSDLDLAQTHLRACLSLNPCQYRAIQLLGQLCAFKGETEQSVALFEHMLAHFPNTESDGLCYGALAFVYYCAEDFKHSEQMALRALMYADAPRVPLILTLISIAELLGDASALQRLRGQLEAQSIDAAAIQNSLQIAMKVIPPQLLDNYLSSLKRAQVI